MSQEFMYESEERFVKKLKELRNSGVVHSKITTFTPYPVHGMEELIGAPGSLLKFFTLFGAVTGCLTGFAFTLLTVYDWPLIVSGKPAFSIVPFCVIAFELTILFGGVISFLGFLFLSRLPKVTQLVPEKEYGNKFVIVVK